MVIQGPDIVYAAVCLIFVCVSIFCALVRYFHMCRPFNDEEAYFYPARKFITLVYACFALPVVWLFRMDSPDAWLFVRVYLILFLPGAGILSFRRYFFAESGHHRFLFVFSWVIPMMLVLVLWLFAWMGGNTVERHHDLLFLVAGGYSLLLAVELVRITMWLCRQIHRHLREEYSNEEDFPVRFARFVAFIPLFYLAAAWMLFLSGSREYNMWFQIFISLMHLVFLLLILHPQRKEYQEVVEEAEEIIVEKMEQIISDQNEGSSLLSAGTKDELEAKIRTALTVQKLYLNPNLKVSDLAEAIQSNKKYVSIVMNERFGSFYTVLNRMRLDAAAEYKKDHPSANREEIARHSGFSNVKTYSRNLKSATSDNDEMGTK